MAIRRVTCFIAVCDLCGRTDQDMGADDYTPHFDTAADALTHATADENPTSGWALTEDGQLVCDHHTDTAHQTARRTAGKHVDTGADQGFGPDTMRMEFAAVRADKNFRL